MALTISRTPDEATRCLRIELRWLRHPAHAYSTSGDTAPFCSVRYLLPIARDVITVKTLRDRIADSLRRIGVAGSRDGGSPAGDGACSKGETAMVCRALLEAVRGPEDVVLLAPAPAVDGGDVAATPLQGEQRVADAVPPPCFVTKGTRLDDVWLDDDAELEAKATAVAFAVPSDVQQRDIQARIHAALQSTPTVRALSTAVLVRLRRDIAPVMIHDPLTLTRVFGGTHLALHEDADRNSSAAEHHQAQAATPTRSRPGEVQTADPAAEVRAQIAALKAMQQHDSSCEPRTWSGVYTGAPSWWRRGSDFPGTVVVPHARTRLDPASTRHATHLKTELVFIHKATGARLLSTITDVPRPSTRTAADVDAFRTYLEPYAELAAEEAKLPPVATAGSVTRVTVQRVEYLDSDFTTFVLVTPSSVANAIHRQTRALRVHVELSNPTHREVASERDSRRAQLAAVELPTPPQSSNTTATPQVSTTTASAATAAAAASNGGSRLEQSMLMAMNTRARVDALAALAMSLDEERQVELDSGVHDDNATFLAAVISQGVVRLVEGTGP
jgi:hypothetical protein